MLAHQLGRQSQKWPNPCQRPPKNLMIMVAQINLKCQHHRSTCNSSRTNMEAATSTKTISVLCDLTDGTHHFLTIVELTLWAVSIVSLTWAIFLLSLWLSRNYILWLLQFLQRFWNSLRITPTPQNPQNPASCLWVLNHHPAVYQCRC